MRTVLILFSLVPICSLGADLVIRILFPPAGLLSSEQTLYSTGELLLVMADIILWGVYYWQQGRSINQQLKRQGMPPLLQGELFRGTITEAKRPYLREGRLTFIVWIGIAFFMLVSSVVGLILAYSVSPLERLQHIRNIALDVILLIIPASILIYALLSKDFSRESSQES